MNKIRKLNLDERQKIEIEFWRDSPLESPNEDSIINIFNKISDAEVFFSCINRHYKKIKKKGKNFRTWGWARMGLMYLQKTISKYLCNYNRY
jgi:hypothetical protein